MSEEISIVDFELQECNGSLSKLISNFGSAPKIDKNLLSESKGHSAKGFRSGLEASSQVSQSMQSLLDNSLRFFTQAGVSFQESDQEAARNVNTITRC